MNTRRLLATILLALTAMMSWACLPEESPSRAEAAYQGLVEDYLDAWIAFHPTQAVALGLHQHLPKTEDRGAETVEAWVALNRQILDSIGKQPRDLSVDLRIDLRLLENQLRSELRVWERDEPLETSPAVYARALRDLMNIPAEPRGFSPGELEGVVARRVEAVGAVSEALRSQLEEGDEGEVRAALGRMETTRENLEELAREFPELDSLASAVAQEVANAHDHLRDGIHVREGARESILGRDRFARELSLYYAMEITPEEVADRALAEIETVRDLIARVSREYWEEAYPREPMPQDMMELVSRVSADMEENRSSSEAEALEAFRRFAREAEVFVEEKGIATLPEDRTLMIQLTPESAGPAQRIGFVDSPPPFDPDPMTVLSIPTIPDTFPAREKEDFYRSFNNHFNKFIIIHELFPGHYMQLKLASQNPRRIRSFFPYEPFIEGWATLVETFALDAGWDDFNKLTYLAHLRKRLENANRAYASVQVHCFGWDEDQVREFARERALLAPQFAESLWGRLLRSPMQMTSYFMGKEMFMEVLEGERARLGEDFDLTRFNDIILRAGAVPLDMVPELLAASSGLAGG